MIANCSKCNKEVDTRDFGDFYTNDNELLCYECFLKCLNKKEKKEK